MSEQLQASTDTIRNISELRVSVEQGTTNDNPCIFVFCAFKLNNKTAAGIAFQSQSTKDVAVWNFNRITHNVYDASVIECSISSHLTTTHDHAIYVVALHSIALNERAAVAHNGTRINTPCGSTSVRHLRRRERVDVHG